MYDNKNNSKSKNKSKQQSNRKQFIILNPNRSISEFDC